MIIDISVALINEGEPIIIAFGKRGIEQKAPICYIIKIKFGSL